MILRKKRVIKPAWLFPLALLFLVYSGCKKDQPPEPAPVEEVVESPQEESFEFTEDFAAEKPVKEEPEEKKPEVPSSLPADTVALRIFIPRLPEGEIASAETVPALFEAKGDGSFLVRAKQVITDDRGDVLPPVIVLESPGNRSFYGSKTILKGRVRDSRLARGDNAGSISNFYYSSSHPYVSEGMIPITEGGEFSIEIDTRGIQGDIPLVLQALDGGGNAAELEIVLLDDETGPDLAFITPVDNSLYKGGEIICLGKVQNSRTDSGTTEVQQVSWKVNNESDWTPATLLENGVFYFALNREPEGPVTRISVQGRDFNGYVSEKSIQLPSEGDLPWIEISSPENEAIYNSSMQVEGTLQDDSDTEWENVPLTYSIVGSGEDEEIILSKDGEFSLDLNMAGKNGLQFLLVKAKPPEQGEAHAVLIMEDDGMGPNLELIAPEDSSIYEAYLAVRGRVTNSIEDKTDASEVARLVWELPEINAGDSVRFRKNGSFRFEIPMLGVRGEQTLKLICYDSNGNKTEDEVSIIGELKAEESTHPTLTMTAPEDKDFYGNNIILKGQVFNDDETQEAADQIQHLYYWLEDNGPTQIEEMYFDLDGSFVYAVPTDELAGSRKLTLTAEKKDGTRTSRTVRLLDGSIKPEIAINSPENREDYGMYVMVQGQAFYPDPEVELLKGVKRLSYEVTPETFEGEEASSVTGDISFSEDGRFDFIFRAKDLQGPQLVRITAEGWNGKRSDHSIVLEKGASDIPSFAALSADSSVTLAWDPLPLAEKYILHASFEGEERTIESVRPPHRVANLQNGKRYTYTLEAQIPDEPQSAWSGTVAGIPLETWKLKPRIRNEFGQIRLSWADIPGAELYQVLRAEEEEGKYINLEEPLGETEFIDTEVEFRQKYYYRITPAIPGGVISDNSRGEMLAAPQVKIDLAGRMKQEGTRKVTVDGNYLYIAKPGEGMQIVDITNAYRPKTIATIPAEDPHTLVLLEDYAYIANGERGLLVVDISNPFSPEVTGLRKTSNALDVAVSETHAYVADGTYGLKIIDITNPKDPVRSGTVRTDDAQAVELVEDILFVADGEAGIKIYSINGSSIRDEGLYVSTNARDLSVHGETLFVADGEGGLLILDISDLTRPTPVGSLEMSFAAELEIKGRHAFVLDRKKALNVIDIYNPFSPRKFESFPVDSEAGLAVHGETAFIVEDDAVKIARVNVNGRSYVVGAKQTGGLAYGVQLIGDFAFVADHQGGVKIIDVSDPFDVTEDSKMTTFLTEFAEDFELQENHLFVADGPNGLKVFSVADEVVVGETIEPVGVYQSDGNMRSIFIDGTTGYCSKGRDGFEIVDVSDPAAIEEVAAVEGMDARDIALYNDHLLIAGGKEGLFIGKMEEGEFDQDGVVEDTYALKVKVQDNFAYVVGLNGVSVIDLTDAAAPELISVYESDSCEDIALQGKFAYLAQGYLGFTILDFSNPEHPIKVSVCDDIFAFGVDIQRGPDPVSYAYVTDSEGLNVIEVYLPEWLR